MMKLALTIYFTSVCLIGSYYCCQNVTLLCMIPFYKKFELGTSCATASKMAIKDINSNASVLPNYNVRLEFVDSKVFQAIHHI